MGCDNNTEDIVYEDFTTYLDVEFIFQDKNGNNLINIDDINTFPLSYLNELPQINEDDITFYKGYYYNGFSNEIFLNEEIDDYVWKTCLYGVTNIENYKTNVGFLGYENDIITVYYSFAREGCMGINICSTREEIYYNETLIYSEGNKSAKLDPKYVYITKTKTGTSVKIEN